MDKNLNLINKKLKLFAEVFMDDNRSLGVFTPSLMNGKAGHMLFLAKYYQHHKNEVHRERIIKYLNEIIHAIEEAEIVFAHYGGGMAGFGWLLLYLKSVAIIGDEYDDLFSEIEDMLEAEIPDQLYMNNFDLMHGAPGMGLFLLKRKKYASVEDILHRLDQTAEKTNREIKWSRYDATPELTPIYNMGLAHGNAGTLYFLGKCYEANVLPELCKKLMLGNINFHLNNTQDAAQIGSYFTRDIKVDEYSRHRPAISRLAWCYGDLGVLYALYFAASKLNNELLKTKFLSMLASSTMRRNFDKSLIEDAGFCHGSTGAGYIFLKLYQQTKDEIFEDAYKFWLEKVLSDDHQTPEALGGYAFKLTANEWAGSYDLLAGLGGVGMFLLACLDDQIPNTWDDCFFLS